MTVLRTGVDMVEVERLAGIRVEIRRRFLARVFNERELEEAGGDDSQLAARFAAKEAVAKALGCGIGPVGWKEIELKCGESGEFSLVLSGNAEALATEQGLTNWSVSISATAAYAVALVVAYGEDER